MGQIVGTATRCLSLSKARGQRGDELSELALLLLYFAKNAGIVLMSRVINGRFDLEQGIQINPVRPRLDTEPGGAPSGSTCPQSQGRRPSGLLPGGLDFLEILPQRNECRQACVGALGLPERKVPCLCLLKRTRFVRCHSFPANSGSFCHFRRQFRLRTRLFHARIIQALSVTDNPAVPTSRSAKGHVDPRRSYHRPWVW